MSDAAAAFWRFSLAVYASADVATACIVLQDEYGKDVNVALFCCWLGASGRGRISPAFLDAAVKATEPWRHGVVEHFRTARRAVKALAVSGSENLYTRAKAVELEAERLLQTQLVEHTPPVAASQASEERLADALANLTLYVGQAPAEPLRIALVAMARDNFEVGLP